jgi:hypothetical protein
MAISSSPNLSLLLIVCQNSCDTTSGKFRLRGRQRATDSADPATNQGTRGWAAVCDCRYPGAGTGAHEPASYGACTRVFTTGCHAQKQTAKEQDDYDQIVHRQFLHLR